MLGTLTGLELEKVIKLVLTLLFKSRALDQHVPAEPCTLMASEVTRTTLSTQVRTLNCCPPQPAVMDSHIRSVKYVETKGRRSGCVLNAVSQLSCH